MLRSNRRSFLVLGICLSICGQASYLHAAADDAPSLVLLKKQYHERHSDFANEMLALANICEQQSFFSDAATIRNRAESVEKNLFDLDQLPEEIIGDLPPALPPAQSWRLKLRKLERDFANDLYLLARKAINQGHASFAFRLVREVAFHDPDHKHARGLLGFVRDGNAWTTPFAKLQKFRKYVDHPRFGWILERNINKYENGERYFNGEWISAEKEASQRSNFRFAWVIETEHFEVTTNHSLEKGVEIGRALEVFHRFFIREYAAFFDTPQQMKALFNTGSSLRTQKRYRVYYYSSQQEFVSALQAREPRIGIINGLYMPYDQVAYFFHPGDDETNFETMFHEVTHQLLSESTSKRIDDLAEHANFWLVEGIASYMESFNIAESGAVTVGNPHHIRMYWANKIVVDEKFYVPLQKFTSLGKNEFQGTPTNVLSKYYSQGSGLAYFLLHYEDGRYRDAFIEHMSQVYSPNQRIRDRPRSIAELTGVSFATLDQQYVAFIESLRVEN